MYDSHHQWAETTRLGLLKFRKIELEARHLKSVNQGATTITPSSWLVTDERKVAIWRVSSLGDLNRLISRSPLLTRTRRHNLSSISHHALKSSESHNCEHYVHADAGAFFNPVCRCAPPPFWSPSHTCRSPLSNSLSTDYHTRPAIYRKRREAYTQDRYNPCTYEICNLFHSRKT